MVTNLGGMTSWGFDATIVKTDKTSKMQHVNKAMNGTCHTVVSVTTTTTTTFASVSQ